MIDELGRDAWATVLDDADPPTPGTLVGTLAERFDLSSGDADSRLEDVLADPSSPIRLDEDASMFGHVVLDDTKDDADTSVDAGEGAVGDGQDVEPLDAAVSSGRTFLPRYIKNQPWWINWVMALPYGDAGDVDRDAKPTKQPVAPYNNGTARPVSWHFGLPDDEHPCTDYEDVAPWEGWSTRSDVYAPDRVVSDDIGSGIILPVGQGDDAPERGDRTVLLIDWDDVRDPSDGSIHPVVGRALAAVDCYAEISQSGEGIHQFVFGEIPGGMSKFIRHIDDEPFIGDDLPDVEIYQSGRVCAMTGDHVEGSGEDVGEGQDLVDRLCWEFGTADNAGPGTPTDPFGDRRDADRGDAGDVQGAGGSVPDHETVDRMLRDAAQYTGEDPDDWEIPDEWSLEYAAVLRARERSDELSSVSNWELNGYAAALGNRLGLGKDDVVADLEAVAPDDGGITKEVRGAWRKADAGNYKPPSRSTLARRGILPERYDDETPGDEGPRKDHQMVVLPNDDELDRVVSGDAPDPDVSAVDAVGDEPPAGALTVAHARERTKATILDAYRGDDDVLVEALPSCGKSYGSVAAAVESGKPVTILTGRGNKEQYGAIREWARANGLDVGKAGHKDGDVYTLPAFHRDCETANGTHGDDWADMVDEWYAAGATPAQIHAKAEYVLAGEDDHEHDELPCQQSGSCEYTKRWDFDPEDYDILIGHYAHAHKPKVTTDRVVVLDEFPAAYESTLADEQLQGAVTRFLQEHRRIPYTNWTDLVSNRDDHERRDVALGVLQELGVGPDEFGAMRFDGEHKHALAPVAIWVMLRTTLGGTLGNGYERVDLELGPTNEIGIFDHGNERKSGKPAVHLLRPPRGFDFADVVVGLDGTPTPDMWELATGRELKHETVLEGRRAEYLEVSLGFRIIQTSEYVKTYNNTDYVNVDEDAALLQGIAQHHGEKPGVITTSTAVHVWNDAGLIDYDRDEGVVEDGPVSAIRYHGNVLGSNRLADKRLGVLVGSNHYGDGFVKRWGAYAGEAVTRDTGDDGTTKRGVDLSYGEFGNKILQHMREHDTLQALLRFGRDAGGAVVYVHTDTLPDWVPTHDRGSVSSLSGGMVGVLQALDDLEKPTPAGIHDHESVSVSRRQVHTHLKTLKELGVLDSRADPDDGRRTLYEITSDDGITDHGLVDLPDEDDDGEGDTSDEDVVDADREQQKQHERDDVETDDTDDDAETVEPKTTYVRHPGDDYGDELDEYTPGVFVGSGILQSTVRRDLAGDETTLEIGATARLDHERGVSYIYSTPGEYDAEIRTRGVTPYTRRRRRLPRRDGTARVGPDSRRRSRRSRFLDGDEDEGDDDGGETADHVTGDELLRDPNAGRHERDVGSGDAQADD